MAAHDNESIRRVGIVFSGGPAPGANAVISAAATSFLEDGREVVGFFHGYSNLQDYHPVSHRLLPDRALPRLRGTRPPRDSQHAAASSSAPRARTRARASSAARTSTTPTRTARLRNVYNALVDLEIDALISIGGDDTLKTANFLYEFQKRLPAERAARARRPPAQDHRQRLPRHRLHLRLLHRGRRDGEGAPEPPRRRDRDRAATSSSRRWVARPAGSATASRSPARRTWSSRVEDVDGAARRSKRTAGRDRLDLDALADRIVDLMLTRERRGKHYGTVVLAEGLAEMLPEPRSSTACRATSTATSRSAQLDLGKLVARAGGRALRGAHRAQEEGRRGVQLGYESRCAPPHAFDVMLGSQLGIGAYRALVEEGLDGHMVSVSGQLELHYVPFADLVDPEHAHDRGAASSSRAATSTAWRASSRPGWMRSRSGARAAAARIDRWTPPWASLVVGMITPRTTTALLATALLGGLACDDNGGGSSSTTGDRSPTTRAPGDGLGECPTFQPGRSLGTLASPALVETSGVIASRRQPDVMWVHNDSGDTPRVFAISSEGVTRGEFQLAGASARDWEDIALGPGPAPDTDYLYVGDIGDNTATRDGITVYRVAEPTVEGDASTPVTVDGVVAMALTYPDGPHDAETLLVDPATGDILVVTKAAAGSGVYRAAAPHDAGPPAPSRPWRRWRSAVAACPATPSPPPGTSSQTEAWSRYGPTPARSPGGEPRVRLCTRRSRPHPAPCPWRSRRRGRRSASLRTDGPTSRWARGRARRSRRFDATP